MKRTFQRIWNEKSSGLRNIDLFLEARYPNLSVKFHMTALRDMSALKKRDEPTESLQPETIFVQRQNPVTGEVEWAVITLPESSERLAGMEEIEHQVSHPDSRDPIAHSLYLDMLNDSWRNKVYDMAIRKAVTAGNVVLDIGSGTGLLALMAHRALQEKQTQFRPAPWVTTCESLPPMAALTRRILSANGVVPPVIASLGMRSEEIRIPVDMAEKADLLVSEILDSELLGEGLLPTLRHAKRSLLKPNGRVLPHSATIFAQLVDAEFLERIQRLTGCGAPGGALRGVRVAPQWAVHVDSLFDQSQRLSNPFEVFHFELGDPPPEGGRVTERQVAVTGRGRVRGVVSWWVLNLDEEKTLQYSTAPSWIAQPGDATSATLPSLSSLVSPDQSGDAKWRDHWRPCLHVLSEESGPEIARWRHVICRASHDDVSVRYAVLAAGGSGRSPGEDLGEGERVEAGPDRVLQMAEFWEKTKVRMFLEELVASRDRPVCLLPDDSLPLPLLLLSANHGAAVVSLAPGLGPGGRAALLASAGTSEGAPGGGTQLAVVGKRAAELAGEDIGGRKVDFVIAEPFYAVNKSQVPWSNLRFWYDIHALQPHFKQNVEIVPQTAVLRAVLVQLPDFWRSRRRLDDVAGFDQSDANELLGGCGASPNEATTAVAVTGGKPLLAGPILAVCCPSQCGSYKELSERQTMASFNLASPPHSVKSTVNFPLADSGVCHGVVVWIDWILSRGDPSIAISTAPSQGTQFRKQGVRLMRFPIDLQKEANLNSKSHQSIDLEVEFDCKESRLNVDAVIKYS